MDYMLMLSLHSLTRCGGIGVIILMAPDGVGDGLVLTMVGVAIIPAIGVVGTVAAIGAVIGDITTDIIRAGVVEVTTGLTARTPIVVLPVL